MRAAFTLAEVLITLGIIGVVAAMTMPTLLNKTRNKELHTAFLKTYSELNQVAGLFKADYGVSVSEYMSGQISNPNAGNGLKSDAAKLLFSYYKGAKNLTKSGMGTDDGEGNFVAYYQMNNLNGSNYSGGANSGGKNSSFLCDNSAFTNNQSGALMILNDAPLQGQNGPVICVDVNGKKVLIDTELIILCLFLPLTELLFRLVNNIKITLQVVTAAVALAIILIT